MKVFYTYLLLLLSFGVFAQPFTNMPSGNGSSSITTCSQQIRDHGGNGNYSNNQNSTLTICSGSAAQFISLNFTQFNLETNNDFLSIYAGPTATGAPLATLTGTALSVTNYQIPSNCVTLVFTSDGNVTSSGFRVTVSCYTSATCSDGIQNGTETGIDCGGCSGCPPCPTTLTPSSVTATASTYSLPCGGGNVNLLATGVSTTPVLSSTFDAGNPGPGWTFTGSGMFTNPCGPSPSGTTHLWFGNTSPHPRILTTNGMDLSCGGTICFDFKMAIQGQTGSCEGPDLPNEGMTLSYSTDCGVTFQNIAYFHPNGTIIGTNPGTTTPGIAGATAFTNWNNYCFPLPIAAQTPNTIIQWSQLATSGAQYDHWGLDQVFINANNCNPYYYDWAHVAGTPNPPGNTVNITSTTNFNVIYTNGINDTSSATVTVVVAGPVNSTISTTPVDYCVSANSGSATFTGNGTANPPYTFAVAGPNGYTSSTSGNPSSTITNLAVGNYTLTTSDGTGCTKIDTFSIVGGPFCCDVFITPTNLTCNAADAPCNGSTNALPTNGLSPYTYQWYQGSGTTTPLAGQTNQIMGSLCAGTYTVLIADQSGCTDSATITLTQPTPLTFAGTHTNVSCYTSSNGTISTTAGGGSPTYTYTLGAQSNTTGNFTGLSQGNYNITATDLNGCSNDTNITITEPPLLGFNILSVTNAFCSINNGTINLAATGGTGPYTYNNGTIINTNGTFTGLAPGAYTILITDANGCTVSTYQIVINGNNAPIISIDSIAHETCFGSNSGYISVSVTGNFPAPAYDFSINGSAPGNQNTWSNLAAGTYTIVVDDPNNCVDSITVTIASPPLLTATTVQTNVSCFNTCTGTITPTITGGVAPYIYSLNGGVVFNNPPLTGLCAGTYFYVVQDSNGCLANQAVTITQPADITHTATIVTATCGFPTGSFAITSVTGGSGSGYTFSFGPAGSGSAFSTTLVYPTLSAGLYYLVIMDGAGCIDSNIVLIQNIEAPLLLNTIVVPNLCFGQALGGIIATATDTTALSSNPPPYNFSINGGPFTVGNIAPGSGNSFDSLANGTYITQVQDQFGCLRLDTLTISSPPQLLLFESHQNLSCNGNASGYINLIASGGTGPGTYTYDIGGGNPTNTNGFFGGLAAGSYAPIVTDTNGCTRTLPNILITEPSALTVSVATVSPLCNSICSGTINFTANNGTPGYTYSINNGTSNFSNPNFTNVCAGTYTYLITDSRGCTLTGGVTLTNPPALSVSAVNTSATCNNPNGTITATGSGGTGALQYNLNGGVNQTPQLFSGLAAGSYLVNVIDANSCPAQTTTTVGQAGAPSISSTSLTHVSCNSGATGSVTVNGIGGTPSYSYSLNGGPSQINPTFSGLFAGTYTVVLTDALGCTANASFTITQPTPLVISNAAITNVSCNGASTGGITITATGGTLPYQYSFNGGATFTSSNSISSVGAGTYSIQVLDAKGCLQLLNVTVTQPTPLAIAPTIVNASCFGICNGSINLNAVGGTGPYNYNWTFNVSSTGLATNLCAGAYSAIITDNNGCILNTGNQTVAEPPLVLINSVLADSVSCSGLSDGVITINSINTTNYQINGPSGVFTNNTGGFTGLLAGLYNVTVSNAGGCQATSLVVVYEPNVLAVTNSGNVVSCPSTPVVHSVFVTGGTPPYSYAWSNADVTSSTSVVATGPLTLTVDVSDSKGCAAAQSTVSHTVTPIIQIDPIAPIYLCEGDSTLVTATAQDGQPDPQFGYIFTWNHLDPTIDTNQAYLSAIGNPSSYWVVVKDMCNDFDSTEVLVYAQQVPILTLTGPADGCSPQLETFTITSPTPLSNCTWDFGDATTGTGCGTVTHTYTTPGMYTVQFDFEAFTGCPFDTTFTNVLEIFENPVIDSIQITDPLCFGGLGSFIVYPSIGTPAYSYSANGPLAQASGTFPGMLAGPYSVEVIDQNLCSVDSLINLIDPPLLAFASISTTNLLCFGDTTASITITTTGGTPALQYSYDGGLTYSSSSTAINLSAGFYHLFVQDANGCTIDSTNVEITQPNELLVDLVSISNASCYNVCDGDIFVGYTGGTAPITYTWSPNAATGNLSTASSLCDDSYDVILTDLNGCSVDTLGITVTEPPQIVIMSLIIDSVTCNGVNDGEIIVAATNGDNYELTGPMPTATNTTGIFSNLMPGTYTLTVYDVNGCSIDTVATIFEPALFTMTNSGDTTVCYGVPVTHLVTPSGGTTPYTIQWNTGATGTSTTYTAYQDTIINVTAIDPNGCIVDTQYINVTVIPLLTIDPIADQTICIGDSTLTSATAQDGLVPYTFHWNHLPLGNNTNPVYLQGTNNPNVYWVSVTDACNNVDSTQVNVFNYTAPTFNLTGPVDGCSPQNETFSIVGTSSAISNCSWDFGNGQTAVGCGIQNSLYNIPDTYSVSFSYTAFAGCTFDTIFTDVLEIFENPIIDSIQAIDPLCFGSLDGQITIFASLGTAPYSYQLGAGASTLSNNFTGLGASLYSYTVSDINNCVASDFVVLIDPPVLTIDQVVITNALCNGDSTGTITLTALGGTAPYQYSFDAGVTYTSNNASGGLPAGTYHVFVRDTNLCTVDSMNVIITQPTPVQFNFVNVVDASCFSFCDGAIDIGGIGGTGAYTYSWSTNASTGNSNIATALCADTFNATITDANGCSVDSIGIIVNQPPQIVISSIVTDSVNCFGGADGTATITAVNAVTYAITGPVIVSQASNVFTNLLAGTYALQLIDANGCTKDSSFVIYEPTPITFTSITITPNLCNGDNTGIIAITGSGGTGAYTYSFDGGLTYGASNTDSTLTAGSHNISILDANGCAVDSIGVIITEPTATTIDVVAITNTLCNGDSTGTITLTGSGGTAPYQYSFNAGVTYSTNNVSGGLPAGTYHVFIRDSHLCTVDSMNVIITQPTPVQFNFVNVVDASCFSFCDGAIDIGGIGGTGAYTYSWSTNASTGNSNIATALCADTFNATITDANGCSVDSIGIIVNQPPQIVISSIVTDSVNCFGGADGIATITAVNAVTYAITGPVTVSQASNVFTNLLAGTYALQLIDANGCTKDSSFVIYEPTPITFTSIVVQTNLCNGDATGGITITGTGGTGAYTYSFDGGLTYGTSNTDSTLMAGSYNISILDANGCAVDSLGVIVNQPTAITIDAMVINDASCFGTCDGDITATVSGGTGIYTYTWSANAATGNTNTAIALCDGSYNLQIVDANGCVLDTNNNIVGEPGQVIFITVLTDSVSCFGGNDGQIDVTATNATTYSLNGGPGQPNGIFNGLSSGFYTITIFGANGCSATTDTTIYQPTPFTISTGNDTTVCTGTNANLFGFAAGGITPYSFQWTGLPTGANQVVSPTATTTYYLNATDANGCPAGPDSTLVNVFNGLTASPLVDATVCPGGSSVVNANVLTGVPVYTYAWSPAPISGQGTATANLAIGNYNLLITDNCGATVNQTVNINAFPEPTFNFLGLTSGCAPHSITVDPNNATIANCSWTFGDGSTGSGCGPVSHTYNNAGVYSINFMYTSANGCSFDTLLTNTVTVSPTPIASFTFNPAEPSLTNNTVSFTNTSVGGSQYSWTFGASGTSTAQNPVYSFPSSNPMDYDICLTVFDVYPGYVCSSTICEVLPLNEEFSIYVPNAFTPDNNEHNNEFRPIILGEKTNSFEMQIFNRWGELIYESFDHTVGWDGTYKGQVSPDGVYIWKIRLKIKNIDDVKTYTGHVTILR